MTSHRSRFTAAAVLALGLTGAQAQEPAAPTTTDEAASMPGMDHSQMDHATTPATPANASPHAGHEMRGMQGGPAPADARDPHAYAEGYRLSPSAAHMGGHQSFSGLIVDRLEAVGTRDTTTAAYDLHAWYGGTYDRTVFKAEGDVDDGTIEDARTELLWGHAVAIYWDTQLGARWDSGGGENRGWLALGLEGLAPYWFEVEATAYVGDRGRTALRLATEYELLLTQRLVLQPRVEANFYGQSDPERGLGAGLSDLVAGVRLRYEIRREFAPYVGVEWAGKFGTTADLARAAGADPEETRVVAGLRLWY
jgi:copper resistance protein B